MIVLTIYNLLALCCHSWVVNCICTCYCLVKTDTEGFVELLFRALGSQLYVKDTAVNNTALVNAVQHNETVPKSDVSNTTHEQQVLVSSGMLNSSQLSTLGKSLGHEKRKRSRSRTRSRNRSRSRSFESRRLRRRSATAQNAVSFHVCSFLIQDCLLIIGRPPVNWTCIFS